MYAIYSEKSQADSQEAEREWGGERAQTERGRTTERERDLRIKKAAGSVFRREQTSRNDQMFSLLMSVDVLVNVLN